jgi:beta-lactamase class A
MVPYTSADLLEYAPIAKANLAKGALSFNDLCGGAVELSDNTCANLLLAQIGGPAALTKWLRSIGDRETRLDRNEPSLNSSIPGDPRDTTTPRAMLGNVRKLLLGGVLKPASRERLTGWMVDCKTGESRIRAGLPKSWKVGDKTGTGGKPWFSTNDVAIAWPPNRPPVLVFAYLAEATKASAEAREGALAEVGKIAAAWIGD